MAGALEGNTVVVDLDGEGLDEDRSDGKGTKGTFSIDIKDTR